MNYLPVLAIAVLFSGCVPMDSDQLSPRVGPNGEKSFQWITGGSMQGRQGNALTYGEKNFLEEKLAKAQFCPAGYKISNVSSNFPGIVVIDGVCK